MKMSWMSGVAGVVVMTILGLSPALAQAAPDEGAAAIQASEARFHSVASHLDLGGDFYLYLNVDDLLEAAVSQVQSFLEPFAEEEMIAMIDQKLGIADGVLRDAGVYNIASIGMSSKPRPDGLNRVKSFVGIDGFLEQGALWKVFGGAPSAMEVHTFIPEGAAMVRSLNLDLPAAWSWIRSVIGDVGGEQALTTVDEGLEAGKQAMGGVHLDDVLASLGTTFMVSAFLDPDETIRLPLGPEPKEIPAPSVLLAIAVSDSGIYELMQTQLTAAGMLMTNRVMDGIEVQMMPEPFPAPVPLQPAMVEHDGFLLIASTPALLQRALAARAGTGRFIDSTTFADAFEGLPKAVNGLAYVDAVVSELIIDIQLAGMQQDLADQPKILSAMREYMKLFADAEGAAVQVNLPDGILMEAVSSTSGREQIATLVAVVPAAILGAVAVPAVSQARTQAQVTACTANLHMIDSAKQMVVIEGGLAEGDALPPDALMPYFSAGNLPVCPQGGAYTPGPIGVPPACSLHGPLHNH